MRGKSRNERTAHYLETINSLGSLLMRTDSAHEAAWIVAKHAVGELGYIDCIIYLINDDKELVQIAAHGNKNPSSRHIVNPIKLKIGEGICGHVALTGVSEIVRDTSKDPRYLVDDELRHSEMTVPIFSDDHVIGIIDSEHPNKDYFSDHDLKIFKSIASILSFKISQVKAIEDLATINKELEVQNLEKQKQANELVIAKKEYDSQNQQQKKIVDKLSAEIVKLEFENHQNKTKAIKLDIAINKSQKEAEAIAIKEIAFKKELKKTRIETESIANELRQFIETANAPIFGIDSEGMVNEWNQTSEKITGFTKKEVLGQDLVKRYITSAYQTKVKKVLDNALKGEETANFEFPIFSKDGNRVMILLNSSTRRNVNGEIVGMLGVGQDISKMDELRTVSDAIAKELRQFIETANAPIFGIDSNGMVNEWNQSSEKITGFTKEEVLGEDLVATYINSNYQKSVKKVLDNAQRGVETANFEFPLYAKDGKRIMILLNSSTRRNSDGKIIGMLGVGQDITILNEYKKNLESKVEYRTQELQESLEREKELGQLKTSFVSMASHEFRTPLTSIKAISDIILRYSNKLSQESINARLEKIKKEVDDMTIMLDDILIIGKSEAQKLAFNPDIEDIVFLIRQIITEYQFSDTTNRQLIYDIPNSIIMINVDKKWIKHIIINLISNAEKYSNKNTPIKISIHQNQSNISFSFQDYGIGISKQDIKKLFEPFHRGSNAQNIPGTGLGLSVLQQAVDLHNGKIEVESNLGKGSKFKIILPYNID
ncbi:PAS domain-containing protein [uncultured Algibacter sp.]|uniref:PAS domain-containing protein n=1 Tax=uncultured Algibacter sp. TaxID=298659 RepID=UPI0025E1F52B|nr:PAS domain-containing protein [uncultured Algibacter sp.]